MNRFPESIGYFEVSHTADIAIAVTGDSIASLFQQSYFALKEMVRVAIQEKNSQSVTIQLRSKSIEALLIAFLNEIIVFLDQESWPVISEMNITEDSLDFTFDLYDCITHGCTIKAATYNEVEIVYHSGFFSTMLVFDV